MEGYHMLNRKIALVAGTIAVSAACAAVSIAVPAYADDESARTLVNAVAARAAPVSGYSADISLHVAMHSFPFIRMTIAGSTTYRQPAHYTVSMHTLPVIAKAFQSV